MTRPDAAARILGRTGESAGITHDIGGEVRLGRSASNDIVINSPFLSGAHARIWFENGHHWIEDLDSRNGTRVDGVSVTSPVCLGHLHVITLADAIDLVYVRHRDEPAGGQPAVSRAVEDDAAPDSPPTPPVEPEPSPAPMEPGVTVYNVSLDSLIDPRSAAPPPRGSPQADEGPPAPPAAASPPSPPQRSDERELTPVDRTPDAEGERTMVSAFDPGTLVDPRRAAGRPAEPAPSPATCELILSLPDGGQQVFALKPGPNVLGRADDCDVTIPDPDRWLSRHHAILTLRPDGASLSDGDTMNGTFIAGVQIQTVEIAPDTTFRLGPNTELKFVQR